MKYDIKIGADPEIFLRDRNTKKFISAAGYFPGTKKEPFKVENGAVQVDGTALEFNIDPARTEDEFFKNICSVLNQVNEMVWKTNKDWELCITPVAKFEDDEWLKIPEDAKILGCDPDYSCIPDAGVNPNPGDQLITVPLRTGSGHIHLGWSKDEDPTSPEHFEDCRFMAHAFHKENVFSPRTREEYERLKYYGANGAFRPKPYGVELRSSSNIWLRSEMQVREVFRKTHQTFHKFAGA